MFGTLGAAALTLGSGACLPALAQSSELVAEVGATWSLPPIGVTGSATGFMVAGLRAGRWRATGTGVHGSVLVGQSLQQADAGDVVSLEFGGAAWREVGDRLDAGIRGRAFGFRIDAPIEQRSGGVEGAVLLRWSAESFRATVSGTGGVGQSRLSVVVPGEGDRPDRTRERTDDLWRYGTEVELLWGDGPILAGVGGGLHQAADGRYARAGVEALAGVGPVVVQATIDRWNTPFGDETTGGLAFHIPVGPWSARGVAGRPDPDPLLRDEPGRGVRGFMVGRRVLGGGATSLRAPAARPSYTLLEASDGRSRVRFEVTAPASAEGVAVLGDFTLWDAAPMVYDGDTWSIELEVPEGTHHFGFMLDGAWYIPDDAPDVVPDEWGRTSMILIVGGGAS